MWFSLGGSFRNFGYLGESRESPILEFGISRTVFGDSLANIKFNALETNLLTSIQINDTFSEALKLQYTLVYREGHLSRNEYLCLKRDYGKYMRRNVL